MKYSEQTLQSWTAPASDTEKQKQDNAYSMIKSAIDECAELEELTIEVFVQGSYANNTNIRVDSDVDVCVMLKSTFFTEYPDGKNDGDYGFYKGTILYEEYKRRVKKAIVSKFGAENVTTGNKSIKIRSNSYRVNADVVVAFLLKNFRVLNSTRPDKYIEGIRFNALDGTVVTNYPKEHIKNGIEKNNRTNHKFKYLTRIFKRIRSKMIDDRVINGDTISSFLVECLIWNIPSSIITENERWTETVKKSIQYIYKAIREGKAKDWTEISQYLSLFNNKRKWTIMDVKIFLGRMWNYLEF